VGDHAQRLRCSVHDRLPQNGREDKTSGPPASRRKPLPLDDFTLTHQCTNWEMALAGQTDV
jgi:hypothetical protein